MNKKPDINYLRHVTACTLMKHPALRAGQAYFNALCEIDPVLAHKVQGGPADPFYDDTRIDDFLAACRDEWGVEVGT